RGNPERSVGPDDWASVFGYFWGNAKSTSRVRRETKRSAHAPMKKNCGFEGLLFDCVDLLYRVRGEFLFRALRASFFWHCPKRNQKV
ncbi:MAG: hypothetical protein AAGC84_02945, partial [Pseudomonas sp.]